LKLKETNPNITLKDIIKSKNIRYRAHKLNLEIKFDLIEKEIIKFLDKININQEAYTKYVNFVNEEIDRINFDNKEKYSKMVLQLNRAK